MPLTDHLGKAPAATAGMVLRDLGRIDEGYRVFVVSWRAALYRLSFKREPSRLVLAGDDRVRPATQLDIVVARCLPSGELDPESCRIEEGELLEELRAQVRVLAAWAPS